MDGRNDCRRYEPTLEEMLEDDVMTPVLRSAGLDAQGFREMIVETARRFDNGRIDNGWVDDRRLGRRSTRDDDHGNR